MKDLRSRISQEARAFRAGGFDKPVSDSGHGSFGLSGLLALKGPDFVDGAYRAVLGRKPDPAERERCLKDILGGRLNRVDVLGRLRRSPEGRDKGTRLPGLYFLYGLQALARRLPERLAFAAGLLRRAASAGAAALRAPVEDKVQFNEDMSRRDLTGAIRALEEKLIRGDREIKDFREETRRRLAMTHSALDQSLESRREPVETGAGEFPALSPPVPRSGESGLGSGGVPVLPWRVYAGFEDLFRGPRDEVIRGLRVLAPFACSPDLPGPAEGFSHRVLDLGCGRGEWLEILQEHRVSALGVDLNPEFVAACRAAGLDVRLGDVFSFLASLPDNCVPVVTAIHLVEHFPAAGRFRLLQECLRVLAPGGLALWETPNPRNVLVGSGDFYRDPDHVTPLFPDTVVYLGRAAGFEDSAACFFNKDRTSLYPAESRRFDSLDDYVKVSRDFVWKGSKPL